MKLTLPSRFLPCLSLFAGSVCLLSAGVADLQAQDQSVSGNLGVTGALDVYGDAINFGSWSNDATRFGLNLAYAEDPGHHATLTLTTTRPASAWLWQQAAPGTSSGSVPQMSLSAGDALTLYDQAAPTPNAAIVLDPIGGSTFRTSVTMNGADNQMPNQTFTGTNSVLTAGLGDARYIPRSTGNTLSLGYAASASGTDATALGAYSSATGDQATALSYGTVASGAYAVALGDGSAATGVQATALGANSVAGGQYSQTLGYGSLATQWGSSAIGTASSATGGVASAFGSFSTASGALSLTLGHNSTADAAHSEALGIYSYAHGDSSVALGFHSNVSGNLSSALGAYSTVSSTVGVALGAYSMVTGYGATALGNGSRADADYSGSIGQTDATSMSQFVVGNYNVLGGNPHSWVPTDDLFTVGNGGDDQHRSNAFSVKKNGDTTVAGNLTVVNAIIVQPQGDLSMGAFTAQPSPAP